ncbi:MAG: hypothetical protein IKS17_10445 [Firmicutes bacterium]|nr:hypothetical protein [Bacillota bacterium]
MKRFLAVFLASTTLFSVTAFAENEMRYVCNNDEADIKAEAIFKDGIVYLPVAQVCRALDYKVIEKESNNSVTAEVKTKPGYFSVFLGKSKGRMNGMDIGLAKTPFKENEVIYVTAGLIEEQLGVSVKYDSSKNTIYIDNTGEGRITSTVGQAPVAKPTASSSNSGNKSSNSNSQSGSYKNYPNTSIPDFASVTGCKFADMDSDRDILGSTINSNNYARVFDKNSNIVGMKYNYHDAGSDDISKYTQTLKNLGFSVNGNVYSKNGATVEIQQLNGFSGSSVCVVVKY